MDRESVRLADVSAWYRTEGFYKRLVGYCYRSMKPFFRGESCLELGCADGAMTRLLLRDFKAVTAVDGSQTYVNEVRKRIRSPKLTVERALFERYRPARTFDTIVMAHVLEHVADPVALLRRSKSWLSKGGCIIVDVPNAHSIHRRVGVKMGLLEAPHSLNNLDKRLGHRRVYYADTLLTHAKRAGLKSIAHTGVFFKPIAQSQIQESWNHKMMDGFFELGKDFPDLAAEIMEVLVPSSVQ